MDIQYVLDPYACATYILSYITKGNWKIKSGNRDIANKVRHIGNKFLNAVEISAQEAAYLVLQYQWGDLLVNSSSSILRIQMKGHFC